MLHAWNWTIAKQLPTETHTVRQTLALQMESNHRRWHHSKCGERAGIHRAPQSVQPIHLDGQTDLSRLGGSTASGVDQLDAGWAPIVRQVYR